LHVGFEAYSIPTVLQASFFGDLLSNAHFLGHNFVMKVLDLHCPQEHQFEGWFASEDDFQSQNARGLIECPMCGAQEVRKSLSAPRLNLLSSRSSRTQGLSRDPARLSHDAGAVGGEGGAGAMSNSSAQVGSAPPQASEGGAQDTATPALSHAMQDNTHRHLVQHQLQAHWLKVVQQVLANTEDVGSQFASEARNIHYGEAEERNIRGQVSADESMALLDEGIAVVPLMVPASLKGSVH
jgi:hypothetical protein